MLRTLRVLGMFLIILIIAGTTYAFAATNTLPADVYAGDGTSANGISGYTVSAVHFTLNTDPTLLDAVVFTLDQTAASVQAKVVTGGGWYTCTNVGNVWTCATADHPTIISLDMLEVVAVQ